MREFDHKLSKVDIKDRVLLSTFSQPGSGNLTGAAGMTRGHTSRPAGIRVAVLAVLERHQVRSNLQLQLFLPVAQRDKVSCGGWGSSVGEESQVALIRGEEVLVIASIGQSFKPSLAPHTCWP